MLHFLSSTKKWGILLLSTLLLSAYPHKRFAALCDVQEIDSTLRVNLMYSRADNFTHEVLYDFHRAYLHPKAAHALKNASALLRENHPQWRLCIFDAARPMSVQKKMWNKVKGTSQNIYVSNPRNGGGLHNYGLAVDITLINEKGDTLPMGTKIDAMRVESHIDNEEGLIREKKLTREEVKNRRILREVMIKAGFRPLKTEWWHFNFTTRKEAIAHYTVIP